MEIDLGASLRRRAHAFQLRQCLALLIAACALGVAVLAAEGASALEVLAILWLGVLGASGLAALSLSGGRGRDPR